VFAQLDLEAVPKTQEKFRIMFIDNKVIVGLHILETFERDMPYEILHKRFPPPR